MITLFRKIRQRFLKENKIRTYSLYAIGEILLVVIGILIALQINNWNQKRSLQQLEQEYLKNLQQEYQANLDHLNLIYKNRLKTVDNISGLMELSGSTPKDCSDEKLATMLNSVYDYGRIVYTAKNPVLEELKSSGNIVNISNKSIRKYLTTWEQILSPIHGNQLEYNNYRNMLLEIIAKYGSMKDIGKAEEINTYTIQKGLDFKNTNKDLLQNKEVGNLLYLLYGELEWFNNEIYLGAKNHLEKLNELIEQELKGN